MNAPLTLPPEPQRFRPALAEAGKYWEHRRITYNAILAGVVIVWVMATWPHFQPAFTWPTLLPLLGLAAIANVCYSAAYVVEIPMQLSAFAASWRNRRWTVWALGMVFAFVLTNYWIADEIYPYIHR
jgi:hypothetical protein